MAGVIIIELDFAQGFQKCIIHRAGDHREGDHDAAHTFVHFRTLRINA